MSTDSYARPPGARSGGKRRARRRSGRRRVDQLPSRSPSSLVRLADRRRQASLRSAMQREQPRVRLDPIGLGFHAAERATASASRTKPLLAMFGDSRVAGDVAGAAVRRFADWEIVNLGVGYQTTAQAILRFDYDVAPFHPAMVVFEIGVNDLKDLSMFPERRDADRPGLRRRTSRRCSPRKRGCAPGIRVVLARRSLNLERSRRSGKGRSSGGQRPKRRRPPREVNVFIRSLARDGFVVFETASVLDGPNGRVRADYQLDHLHLVAPGYAALNERLVSIVRAFPPGPR